MKSDTAIKEFLEKYDERSIQSIDAFSKRFGPKVNRKKFKLFNLKECFDNFEDYLKGYARYKIENVNNDKASPQSAIEERTKVYIEGITKNKDMEVLYEQIPSFVKSYAEGIKSLNETVDEVKHIMSVNDIDPTLIGVVNEFTDQFVTVVTESFDEVMDRLLWSSGYRSNQILVEGKQDPREEKKHVFL